MEALYTYYQFLFFLCTFLLVISANTSLDNLCGPGLQTAGVTVPRGDIIIEYGNPLEIYCILDLTQTNLNSSSLVFYYGQEIVKDEFVQIVNETTLRLFVKKPPIDRNMYYCKLRKKSGEDGVCLNYVFVATKPQEVQNFTCISYNWENLNCSWVPPKNPLRTTYRLSFYLRGKNRKIFQCPGNSDIDNNYCVWNSTTNPPHRMPYEEYYFKLIGVNDLGNLTINYKIDHYAVVLPRKPENLSLIEATSSSLTISWVLPRTLTDFPGGIDNKVLYQSRWDPLNYWQEVDTSNISNISGRLVLNITGLKYAHTLYDIRVLLKSKRAENIDRWWSEPAHITLRTKPTVPRMPPKTDIGSFETKLVYESKLRDIYIYWQQIPQKYENGEDFGYNVSSVEEVVDGKRIQRNVTPSYYKSYALFKNMSFNTFIFKIVSSNKEGISKQSSAIMVPSKAKSPAEPVSLTKVAYEHGVYELVWNAPPQHPFSNQNVIKSYTIFWCDNKRDRPYQCNGALNWTMVNNNVTEKNITLPDDKIFQFAISANTMNSSSGMVWADCTVLPNQEKGKLENIWINKIGADYMELNWKLDCFRPNAITGFEVTYCPIRDPQHTTCKEGSQKNETFDGNLSVKHYTISNLRPYTTYKVILAVVSPKGSLIKSDPLQNTTMEAAPDGPPEYFRTVNTRNTSITVSWKPPSSLNGVLRHYLISWNNNSTLIVDKSDIVKYTLTDLLSFEHYHIKVVACTVACSKFAAEMNVTTEIGLPGQLDQPKVSYFNKTDLNVTWFPLKHNRGGYNELYEIKVQFLSAQRAILSESLKEVKANTGGKGNELEILTPGCEEADESPQLYNVWVRAVNKAYHGTKEVYYKGPWSPPTEGFCFVADVKGVRLPTVVIICFGIVAFLAMSTAIVFISRFIWRRCKAMQNIRVKLPPQLELDMYKDKGIGDLPISTHVCSPQVKSSDNNETPPPDQQLLLEKKDKELLECSTEDCEDASGDRESSGCGSGHESVSSSITAGTHITDSGTEADERPEDVFSDSPRREIYPRQRNVSRSGSGGDGYCILAQAPSGYVSYPPMSGYVKHDWKPSVASKGYEITGSIVSPNAPSVRPQSNETSWAS